MKPNLTSAKADVQLMVRAEAGAVAMAVKAVRLGKVEMINSDVGRCVCVTCGFVGSYKSARHPKRRQMQGGHFAGRRASVALIEFNVHPQCSLCNLSRPGHGGGMPREYEMYMLDVYGREFVDELRCKARNESKHWDPDELLDLRQLMRARIKIAETTIKKHRACSAATSGDVKS